MKYVIKRSGKKVPFDKQKIINAIYGAFIDKDGEVSEYAKMKAENIANYIYNIEDDLSVEEIQDYVIYGLMSTKRKDVATAYTTYRYQHSIERQKQEEFEKLIKEKLGATNVANQNANVDEHSFGGRKGEAANELMKKYALENCISKMARENHLNNMIYIHDLDSYAIGMHNCLSVPFDKLLKEGFNTRQADVRPANSINTAFQLVAVIFQLQSLQQFGGVSATHLDWTMVPYVRKSFAKHWATGAKYFWNIDSIDAHCYYDWSIDYDAYKCDKRVYNYAMDKTKQELEQAVEGMYHNLNY